MKELMFSRQFLKGHPRAGQATYFIVKICKCLSVLGYDIPDQVGVLIEKHHTIRSGNRFKPGDRINFKIWSGMPRRSKKITFVKSVEIKKTWDIEFDENGVIAINGTYIKLSTYKDLAKNDGLSESDFYAWFNELPFKGQIICWDERISY